MDDENLIEKVWGKFAKKRAKTSHKTLKNDEKWSDWNEFENQKTKEKSLQPSELLADRELIWNEDQAPTNNVMMRNFSVMTISIICSLLQFVILVPIKLQRGGIGYVRLKNEES